MIESLLHSFEDTKVAFAYKSTWGLKKARFLFQIVKNPSVAKLATWSANTALTLRLPIKGIIRKTVFEHFCSGESIEESQKTIQSLYGFGVGTILDYSVEGEHTELGFDTTMQEIKRAILNASKNDSIPFAAFKVSGVASVDLLSKVQANESITPDEEEALNRAKGRVSEICGYASELMVPLFADAEDSWYQDVIDEWIGELMLRHNKETAIIYNTFQMYRKDMLSNLQTAIESAKTGGYQLGAKLVRGAYMEKERERAVKLGYPDPICSNKEETDNSYNDGVKLCVENRDHLRLANCSHNEYSNAYLAKLISEGGIELSDERFHFAQLYGMSDNITFNLAREGFNTAKYVVYGPVKSTMPYLTRRAAENTSVTGQSSRELELIEKEIRRRKNSD